MGLSDKFMIVIIALCIVSIWVLSVIKIVLNLLIAPQFGFKCNQISGFGLLLLNEDGKWKCKKNKFSPVIQETLVIDISKPVPEDINEKDKAYAGLTTVIELVISLVVGFFCRDKILMTIKSWNDIGMLDLFLGAFAIGMIGHSLIHIGIAIYTYGVLIKRLNGYTDVVLKKLRQGVPFESMDLKPVSQLPYKNPSNLEKMMYYRIYIPYLIAVGDIDGMKQPMEEMKDYYAKREYIMQETLSYYWLIFYYSRYEINPMNADAFFERVSRTLINDADANAKRVLAYYYYGVKNDITKAQQYIREGFAVIDKFSLPGAERELERKLLLDLDEIIQRRLAYEQGN